MTPLDRPDLCDKPALRRQALARRDALPPARRSALSEAISARVLELSRDWPQGPVAGYWPIRSEFDPRPVLALLAAAGRTILLPRIGQGGLSFRRYVIGDPLMPWGMGLSEPASSAPEGAPAVMLVPLAAFDRRAHRIGYGAGYYDRAIARLCAEGQPPHTVGVAFSIQEVEAVPDEWHDRALDVICTDSDLVYPRPA
jgi:5-formyltetrahydrofolate cyclo-ligase